MTPTTFFRRTDVPGSVNGTLALTIGPPVQLGAFTPGVARDYTGTTAANVLSTGGDAAAPVSHDLLTVEFKQPIGATDPLRTGNYAKTLVFTLSTTSP
jgi:hypothetical protein